MNFDFLIAYRKEEGTHIERVLIETLTKVLEDNLNEFEPEVVAGMIRLQHERPGEETPDEDGNISRYMVLGFDLDLPDETEQIQTVVKEFPSALSDTPPVFHVVK